MIMYGKTKYQLAVLFKLIYKFNSNSIKITTEFFMNLDKVILNLTQKRKAPRIDKTILKKSNRADYEDLL